MAVIINQYKTDLWGCVLNIYTNIDMKIRDFLEKYNDMRSFCPKYKPQEKEIFRTETR